MTGVSSVEIGSVETEGGYREGFSFQHHQYNTKLASYSNSFGKNSLHAIWPGTRGNVVVFWSLSEKIVSNAAPGQIGIVTLLAKAL